MSPESLNGPKRPIWMYWTRVMPVSAGLLDQNHAGIMQVSPTPRKAISRPTVHGARQETCISWTYLPDSTTFFVRAWQPGSF